MEAIKLVDLHVVELIVGNRTYEIIPFLEKDRREIFITGAEVFLRAGQFNAVLGEDEGQYVLDHQESIPEQYRRKAAFLFMAWRNEKTNICSVRWDGVRWSREWRRPDVLSFGDIDRLLRRIS